MRKWQLLVIVCLAGCKAKPEGQKASVAAPATFESAKNPAASPSASAVAAAGSADAEVRAMVARWVAAQNSGDFATYSGLYAERFMGVKRVGAFSKRFDRPAWLVDRKPMLQAGAQVKVSDLEIATAAGSTRAIFTQEFTAKTFKDIGKKELFLVRAPGGLAIGREEMLDSQLGAAGAGDESVLAFQRDGVVVQRGYDKAKLRGRPRLLSSPNASSVEIGYPVAPEALGEGVRAWLGKEATAYAKDGTACSGRVSRFEVRVEAVPHFGMRQSWNGERDQPKASAELIASEIERMAQSHEHFVVGVLDKPCPGTWASGVAQTFVKPLAATGALRQAAVAAFKALPAYGALQRKFVQEMNDTRAWESVDGELNVIELRPTSKPALLVVTARGGVGCGGFSGRLSSFWEIAGSAEAPKLTAIGQTLSDYLALHGALDEGASGLALLVGPYDVENEVSVVRPAATKDVQRVLYGVAFWDCGC